MDIEKKVETTFTLSGIPEETLILINKAINMATAARRVGTLRLSIPDIRILRDVANEISARNAPVIPREMIEDDEDEPEEDEDNDSREYDRAR